MKRPSVRVALLIGVAALIGLLWLWRSGALVERQAAPVASTSSTPQQNLADNFLAPERVPAVTYQALLDNSFLIPAGSNMNEIISVTTTGDIIPARGVDVRIRSMGFDYPFDGVGIRQLLANSDLTIVDLEAPLIKACPVTRSGFTFCGQAPFAGAMAKSGIDVATLANNHIGNYGAAGIQETMQHLKEVGIEYSYNQSLAIRDVKGKKIGILAFNGVGGRFHVDEIKQVIRKARPSVDLLFVAYHWGKEYEAYPTPDPTIAPDDPREIGHMTIDEGADLVIGNHPHWVQGTEIYKGKIISYALGNFIFDQSWSEPTTQGLVGTYTFYGTKLIGAVYTPIIIKDQAQPRIADTSTARTIMGQFQASTRQLAGMKAK
jgi:poly-gamma-glutamate synthesis protein (capsule biosynthesis protein)